MDFHLLLRQILSIFNGERTISAPYHLVKGKKSSQTLGDVDLFQLHKYYKIMPDLTRSTYDEAIATLVSEGHLRHQANNYYTITPTPQQTSALNGWLYQGLERVFFQRLQLVTQTLSQLHHKDMKFIAVSNDVTIQQFVRSFLHSNQYQTQDLGQALYQEIVSTLQRANVTEQQKHIIVYRLSGYLQPAQTLEQCALTFQQTPITIQLWLTEALHAWLPQCDTPLLQQLQQGCSVQPSLTHTASETYNLLMQGYTIDDICRLRQLKQSTIQDHIVEIARHQLQFSITPYVSETTIKEVHKAAQQLQTKRYKNLHEHTGIPYFQIRLAMTREG